MKHKKKATFTSLDKEKFTVGGVKLELSLVLVNDLSFSEQRVGLRRSVGICISFPDKQRKILCTLFNNNPSRKSTTAISLTSAIYVTQDGALKESKFYHTGAIGIKLKKHGDNVSDLSDWMDKYVEDMLIMAMAPEIATSDEIEKSKLTELFKHWHIQNILDRHLAKKAIKPVEYEVYFTVKTPKFMRGYFGVRYCTELSCYEIINNSYYVY